MCQVLLSMGSEPCWVNLQGEDWDLKKEEGCLLGWTPHPTAGPGHLSGHPIWGCRVTVQLPQPQVNWM